jgi:predicted nucleic acid-binding protein
MVIDTNIAIAYIIEGEEKLKNLLVNNTTYAPAFGKIEMLNILRKYHFLKKIPLTDINQSYKNYKNIIDKFVADEEIIDLAYQLSLKLNHPIYDCLFLALSLELKKPFISADQKLMNKAKSIGIETIQF